MAVAMAKAEVSSVEALPQESRNKVTQLTREIRASWKQSVENILKVGKGLEQLKVLLPYKLYLDHIRAEFGLSEAQAWRLVSVWQKFGSSQSSKVLEAKISSLYLLATSPDLKKVETLAAGGRVLISGKKKDISEISVKEALSLKKSASPAKEQSQSEVDRELASNAHRDIATLIEQLSDWCDDLDRISKKGLEIQNVQLVKEYLRELSQTATELSKRL